MTNAFHAFEQAGWNRAAQPYADAFATLTPQTAGPLLEAAGVVAGTRLLDVASGPGFIAAAALARGAVATALDFSPAMIAEAARRHPGLVVQEGDASALPFPDASFDAVVMNFGMLHLARPDEAIAEARRVLRPGGRYAFTVWAAPTEAVAFGIVLRAIERLGNKDVPLPEGPPFFRFSSPDESRQTLEAAGFTDVGVRTVPLIWRVAKADDVFEALAKGGVRTAAVLHAQTPAALDAVREAVRADIEAYAHGNGIEVPMPAILSVATKP